MIISVHVVLMSNKVALKVFFLFIYFVLKRANDCAGVEGCTARENIPNNVSYLSRSQVSVDLRNTGRMLRSDPS